MIWHVAWTAKGLIDLGAEVIDAVGLKQDTAGTFLLSGMPQILVHAVCAEKQRQMAIHDR